MLNKWPQNMRDARRNTYSSTSLSCAIPEPISYTTAEPSPYI